LKDVGVLYEITIDYNPFTCKHCQTLYSNDH